MEAIGRKLELGIFRTSKPIKEEKKDGKKEKMKRRSAERKILRSSTNSPTKASDIPLTQTLLMMKKKDKECFANATVQKDCICREAAHKTISVPHIIPYKSQERAELTITKLKGTSSAERLVKGTKICEKPQALSNSSYSQLVEQQLAELAEQAEHLARALRKTSNDDINCDDDNDDDDDDDDDNSSNKEQLSETTTQFDVDSATLDTSEGAEKHLTTVLKVEIAPPVIKASEELSLQSPKLSKDSNKESRNKRIDKNSNAVSQKSPEIVKSTDNFDLKRLAEATKSLLQFADSQKVPESDTEVNMRARKMPPAMSTSEIHLTDRGRESLADRLSKGLHDLTHGSTDRLQKWKTKLHTGRRAKDQSEPPPTSRSQYSSTMPATDVLLDWTSVRSPRPLHSSKSASNALKDNIVSPIDGMEHRTLKSKENSVSQKDLTFHYQNMNSLQKIMNTMDNFAKTSQFNLPPPVRITPHSGVKPTGDDILRPIAFRPVTNQTFEDYKLRQSQDMRNFERQVIRGDVGKASSYTSQNNLVQRPRQIYQQTTNFPICNNKPIENEYDTVPEYLEKEKFSDFCSSGSDYGSFVPPKLTSSMASSGTGSSHLSSPSSTNKKPSLGRSSSGVHITPSPSDSGIVDFEAVIRDKENELREVRTTMEQNEEIIVKVYQEKEKLWKDELEQLRQRLAAAERGEQGLRTQLAGCQRQTETLTRTVEGLREEKTGLLRKCFQLERELVASKSQLDKPRVCDECNKREKPIPAPRQTKDSDTSIRSEVSSLRDEVATLKEALHEQIKMFSTERKGWEDKQIHGHPTNDRLI